MCRILAFLSVAPLLSACTGANGGGAPFTLTITPHFLEGQAVLANDPDVELVLIPPTGEPEVIFLGEAGEGDTLTVPELPAPEPGTTVGLLIEQGGDPGAWDGESDTRGYGQAPLVEPVTEGAAIEVDILVPAYGEVGRLGSHKPERVRVGAAAAVVPGGDVIVFGGSDPESAFTGEGTGDVFVLDDLDTGAKAFGDAPDKFPNATVNGLYGGTLQTRARVGATATPVQVDGQAMVLVAGGRREWLNLYEHVRTWHLFDPGQGGFVEEGELSLPRSAHLAVPFSNGKVLLFGGNIANGLANVPATYDIWDPERKKVVEGTSAIDARHLAAAAAPYRQDVVVCGGAQGTGGGQSTTWTPTSACNRIQPSGEVEDFEALPVPLAWAAMAPLPTVEGLLVAGGYSGALTDAGLIVDEFQNAPADDRVWRYGATNGWTEVGRLANPRAHHAMIPLADGRVLIVGGTAEATATMGPVPTPVRCPELYDPAGDRIIETECSDAGQGAQPLVAWYPGEAAFVLEGYAFQFDYEGLTNYGLVSLGPPLDP